VGLSSLVTGSCSYRDFTFVAGYTRFGVLATSSFNSDYQLRKFFLTHELVVNASSFNSQATDLITHKRSIRGLNLGPLLVFL
jgi:hypothetical protein